MEMVSLTTRSSQLVLTPEMLPRNQKSKMKKSILSIIVIIFAAVPVISWSLTLSSGLPWQVYLYDISRVLALFGFVIIFFQYIWTSKINWIERDSGQANLIKAHRKLGITGLICIIIHPVLLVLSEKLMGYSTPVSLFKITGIITLLVMIVASGSALFNKHLHLKYKTWKKIHRANYAIFPLGFMHSFFIGSDLVYPVVKIFWLILALIYLSIIAYKFLNRSGLRTL